MFRFARLKRHRAFVSLLQFALLIAAIAVEPQIVLFMLAYTYLASGPVGYLMARLAAKKDPPEMKVKDLKPMKTA